MSIIAALTKAWNVARGNTSAPLQNNIGFPTTIQQKMSAQAGSTVGGYGIDPQRFGSQWVRVASTNVAAIKWNPGSATMAPMTPGQSAASPVGPMGGAPILGGVKTAGGMQTQQVPVGQTQAQPQQATGGILGRILGLIDRRATGQNDTIPPGTPGTLEVLFNSGSHYQYYSVPRQVFDEFYVTSSKGRFVWRRLRGKFAYRRVR